MEGLDKVLDYFGVKSKGNVFVMEEGCFDERFLRACKLVDGELVGIKIDFDTTDYCLNYTRLSWLVDDGTITKEEFDDVLSLFPTYFRKPFRVFPEGKASTVFAHDYFGNLTHPEDGWFEEIVIYDTEEQLEKEMDALRAKMPKAYVDSHVIEYQVDRNDNISFKDLREAVNG